jgi:uncharacterized protein VirK/YbjX
MMPSMNMLFGVAWSANAALKIDPNWRVRARFATRALLHADLRRTFAQARAHSALHEHLLQRPETAGVLIWPYQCAAWGMRERVARVESHFAVVERLGTPVRFSVDDKVELLDLSHHSPGVRVILDQPKWLLREGHLALNLFVGDHRAYSLAFSLFEEGPLVGAFIGGLQGRSTAGALDTYKELTKDFHGMRPRDLLLDIGRIFFQVLAVARLHAVAENHRFFRHPYFGGHAAQEMHVNYDDIWKDRGGVQIAPTHFDLPLAVSVRALDELPSKKRSMYRRRNEMLTQLCEQLGSKRGSFPFVQFDAT